MIILRLVITSCVMYKVMKSSSCKNLLDLELLVTRSS